MSSLLKSLLILCLFLSSCSFSTNIEDEYSETGEFICPLPVDLPESVTGTEANLFQGDILVNNHITKQQNKQAGVINALWEKRTIPIHFDKRWYDNPDKFELVKSAFQHYEEELDFTFIEVVDADEFFTNTKDGVYVKYSGVAASYIGKQGGIQDMYLPASWNSLFSTSVHEIGHLVGLHHPHVTEMQDEWLTIYWDNIIPEKKEFFYTYEQYDSEYGEGDYKGQRQGYEYADEYDIYSIMNYSSYANAIDSSKPTMTLKDGTIFKPSNELSTWDKISIDRMYRCYEKNKPWFDATEFDETE